MTAGALGGSHAQAATTRGARILVLGDSLSAEYGLRRGTGWVALMQARLASEHAGVEVINASISGETTSGGRTRLPALLAQHKPTHVIVELGANDALRGLPLLATQNNLLAITKAAKKAGCRVALLGMQVPPNYGGQYMRDFGELYVKVARAESTQLVPFMLQGVADVADAERWFQRDRIHPVEAAHPLILANVWPVIDAWFKG
ncbi:MAG: arylesterase [Burkholderiales bacterium]|nr:arylesterase [Burkholderiales bacterium]